MSSASSFEVFLTEEAAAALGDDSVEAERLEYYDSGVWISHAGGRDFVPYERVVLISETSPEVETPDETAADEEPDAHAAGVGERRDAASGATESADGRNEG